MAQLIANHAERACQITEAFRTKWLPILTRHTTKFQAHVNELVVQPLMACDMSELSVHAQYILEDSLKKFNDLFDEMLKEHRQIHPPISRAGKELNRHFQMDLSNLLRGEKDIESADPANLYRPIVNRLIFEHLLSLGRVQIAEIFMKECQDADKFVLPSKENLEVMHAIMEPFRARQLQPAIKWVEKNVPEKQSLLFRLHSEHILQLLESDQKKEAIVYCRALQHFAHDYKTEIQRLMYMAVSWSNDAKTKELMKNRYENMFPEGRWLELEQELATCFSEFRDCPLAEMISVGAESVPIVLRMRMLMRRTSQHNFTPMPATISPAVQEEVALHHAMEEIVCSTSVPRVHSSFCCPVLRTQATETNPPMRLRCGHVICNDALTRLANNRAPCFKCPYCPDESTFSEAMRIYF